MSPDAAFKARVMAAAATTPALTRKQGRLLAVVALVLSTGIAFGLFELFGGLVHSRDRPLGSTIKLADGWGLASAALTFIVGRTRGRSPPLLVAVAVACPVLLFAWMRQFSAWVPSDSTADVSCVLFTLALALTPLASFLLLRSGSEPLHPTSLGAAAGGVSGAWSSVVMMLWCPNTEGVHVLVGHVLPMLLLIGIGATLGPSTLGGRR